jgi:PAS domain S-box-containing protein
VADAVQFNTLVEGSRRRDRGGPPPEWARGFVDSAPEAIIAVARDGHVEYANESAQVMFRRDESELVGQPVTRLIAGALSSREPARVAALMHSLAARRRRGLVEVRARTKPSGSIAVEATLAVPEGAPQTCAAIIRDVSAPARREQGLRQALRTRERTVKRLRSMTDILTTMLHAVVHDLTDPLSAIRTLSEVLLDESNATLPMPEADRRQAVQRLHAAVMEMHTVVRTLLETERLNPSGFAPRRQLVDVAAVVRETLDGLGGVDAPVILDATAVRAPVDPAYVQTIVRTLVKNAAQHSQAGEPVTVRIREHRNAALLVVEDRGPGVPRRYRGAIFEPFTRGPRATGSGLGLGLSVVRRLASAHGGRAWVDEVPGGGAAFSVLLAPGRGDDADLLGDEVGTLAPRR